MLGGQLVGAYGPAAKVVPASVSTASVDEMIILFILGLVCYCWLTIAFRRTCD